MNKLTIIGNITRDPELRTVNTVNGPVSVCDFTVAVNSRRRGQNSNGQQDEAQFFRCTAWRGLADVVSRYAIKGTKVCVTGPVSARTYQANDGSTRLSLEVNQVEDFELLTTKAEADAMRANAGSYAAPQSQPAPTAQNNGFTAVESDDLPF